MKEFTFIEINNWRAYEHVLSRGRWNMFDPQARIATGLTNEEYSFTMKNYDKLAEAALEDDKE